MSLSPAPDPASDRPPVVLDRSGLGELIAELRRSGHEVVAPVRRDGVIGLAPIEAVDDLPEGWGDEQEGGRYRLRRRDNHKLFGYAVGPTAPKQFLFPPREQLVAADREGDGSWTLVDLPRRRDRAEPRLAFLGIRPCELAAMLVQDRVFLAPGREDPGYARRRHGAFIAVVNCGDPAATCFCASMGTGPQATGSARGFDLSLTEVLRDGDPQYVVEVGSGRGAGILDGVAHRLASRADLDAAGAVITGAVAAMVRSVDTSDVHDVLLADPDHPRWDDVAQRCLTCANCTLVCPTCFCHTVEDTTDLDGDHAERWRLWDSCFTAGFSELGGHPLRESGRARYRQWLTHKLATWHDQFGVSGCVGCGRCIAWCPVGIDLTQEVAALRLPATADGGVP